MHAISNWSVGTFISQISIAILRAGGKNWVLFWGSLRWITKKKIIREQLSQKNVCHTYGGLESCNG